MGRFYSISDIYNLLKDSPGLTKPKWREDSYPDLSGRTYVVTGASAGIGKEAATLLAGTGARVFIIGRNPSKLEAVVASIKEKYPNALLEPIIADYADLATLKDVITRGIIAKTDRIDGILHNAGLSSSQSPKTKQGYETLLGVNVIAPHLVQKLLDPLILKTASKSPENSVRIVWVSSSAQFLAPADAGIHVQDYNNPPQGLSMIGVYAQSKAMNIYQSIQWAKRHPDSGIIAMTAHPGLVRSDLSRDLNGYLASIIHTLGAPPKWGAYAVLYPLIHPSITSSDAGKFFAPFESTRDVRADILQGANGTKGDEFWKWLDTQIAPYI